MKKIYVLCVYSLMFAGYSYGAYTDTVFSTIYTILNTKCQNSSCHSVTASDNSAVLKFDGSSATVYSEIFNIPSAIWTNSINKHEKLVNPEMPYTSFLLRKVGAGFDTDLALDSAGEGNLMLDVNGNQLSNTEIEFIRQWIRYGAMENYSSTDPQPDFTSVAAYYADSTRAAFLNKPPAPDAGTGFRFRCGPMFLPATGAVEQEILQQQEIYFPYLPQVTRITGNMNQQSHHFILFTYNDSSSARDPNHSPQAPDLNNIAQITPSLLGILGTTSFDGDKNITSAWQEDADLMLPAGTAMMWPQHTYLDMNFHVKNYNAAGVIPCDFYFNVYFQPVNPNTIPMNSHLVNNQNLGIFQASCLQLPPHSLPFNTPYTENYDDQDNSGGALTTRYVWMAAGHTHQLATSVYLLIRDTLGYLSDTIYDGQYDYVHGIELGYWDHSHPPLEYWPNLLPVSFGGPHNAGLVNNTTWLDTVPQSERCIFFGFTTANEMQLFYYMYTDRMPDTATATGITGVTPPPMYYEVVPNPTDNNGKLVYNLSADAKVEASVMDITGRTIATLAEENEQMGLHEMPIANGKKLAPGVYLARLIVNDNMYTKKFVVSE